MMHLWLLLLLSAASSPQERCDDLGCAIRNRDDQLFNTLLQQGDDPSKHVPFGDGSFAAPLQIALGQGREDLAIELLRAGADPSLGPGIVHTALSYAAAKGQLKVVRYLVDNKLTPIDGMGTPEKRFVPLTYGVSYGNLELARLLLRNGADPQAVSGSKNRVSVLDEAFVAGNEHMIQVLLEYGLQLDPDRFSASTLLFAAGSSNPYYVGKLLSNGWDVNAPGRNAAMPLEQAILNCRHQERIVQQMLPTGADTCIKTMIGGKLLSDEEVSARTDARPSQYLSSWSKNQLASAGAGCWRMDKAGREVIDHSISNGVCDRVVPLDQIRCAIQFNDTRVMQAVIESGFELSALGPEMGAVLNGALLRDSQESVNNLLDRLSKSCLMAVDMPLLHRSMTLGRFRTLNKLLIENQHRSCAGEFGLSDLHVSVLELDYEQVNTVLEKGEDPNAVDKYGFTPLMFSLVLGAEDIAFLLVENGANLSVVTNSGHSLYHFAALGDAHFFGRHGIIPDLDMMQKVDRLDLRTPLLAIAAAECTALEFNNFLQATSDPCAEDRYGKDLVAYLREPTIRPLKQRIMSTYLERAQQLCD